jgi:hypothetical protein
MYDLFRLQNRFRKAGKEDLATKQACKNELPPLDDRAKLLPIVRIALHMTHLLLNPVWGSAWHVLYVLIHSRTIVSLTIAPQRSRSQPWRHTCVRNATLGVSGWNSLDPEHTKHIWWQPHPAIFQRVAGP